MDKVNSILELQSKGLDLEKIAEQSGYTQEGRKKVHSMTRFMRNKGYNLVDDKYTNIDDNSNQVIIQTLKEVKNIKPITENTIQLIDKNEILEMVKSDSEIKELLEYFKLFRENQSDDNMNQTYDNKIKIDLNDYSDDETRTTIRLNKDVYQEFIDLCDDNKHLLKKDLLSMALKEYVDKYKKGEKHK